MSEPNSSIAQPIIKTDAASSDVGYGPTISPQWQYNVLIGLVVGCSLVLAGSLLVLIANGLWWLVAG